MLSHFLVLVGLLACASAQQLYPFETAGRWSFVGFLNGRVPTFSDTATASIGVRLTDSVNNQYGAAWLATDRALTTNFAANFVFRIYDGGSQPADGLCFALQTTGVTAGSSGEGLGLKGMLNSLAICFDTYPYLDESRTGVFLNGNVPQEDAVNNFRMGLMLTTGRYFNVALNYTTASGIISWTVSAAASGSTPAYSRSFSKNIGSIAGVLGGSATAWIGFTAATGGCVSKHEILLPKWAPICNASLLALPQQYPYNFSALPGRVDAWRVGCVEGWTTTQTELWQTFISNCSLSGKLPLCVPVSPTPSPSQSISPSFSPSSTGSASMTASPSRSPSLSATASLSPTGSASATVSESPSISASTSVSATASASTTASSTPSSSATPSSSGSPSDTASASVSPSVSGSASGSVSPSVTRSVSRSHTPSRSVSATFDPFAEVAGGTSGSGTSGVVRRTALPPGTLPTGVPGAWVNSTNGTLIFVPGSGSGADAGGVDVGTGGGGTGTGGGVPGDQNAAGGAAGSAALSAGSDNISGGAIGGIVVGALLVVGAAIAGTLLLKAKFGAGAVAAAAVARSRQAEEKARRLRKLVSTPGVVRLNQGANGSERFFSKADAIRRKQGGAGTPATPAAGPPGATPRGRAPAYLANHLSFAVGGSAKPGVMPGTSKLAMRPARPRGMPAGGGGVGGVDGEAFAAALDNPLLLLQQAPPMPPQLSSRSLTSSRSLVVPAAAAASSRGLSPLPSKSPHPSSGAGEGGFTVAASSRGLTSARSVLSRFTSKRAVGPSSRSLAAADAIAADAIAPAEAVQPAPAAFDPSMLPSDLSVLDPATRAAYEAYLASPEYTAWWMANYGHLYDAAVAAQQAAEAAAAAPAEPEPAAAAAPAGVINPFEGLSFPLDPTTAAFMGMDPETGQVQNIAAYYAYYAYANGYDYADAYRHYEAHFTSGGAAADVGDIGKLRGVKRTGQRGGGLPMPAGEGLPPVKLVIGEGKVKTTQIVRGAVKLRRVAQIKGDTSFVNAERKEITWEEVKERKEVELDSSAMAARGSGSAGGAGAASARGIGRGGAGGPTSPNPGRLFSKSGRRL